jgi:iron complex outermembrane receptor protein
MLLLRIVGAVIITLLAQALTAPFMATSVFAQNGVLEEVLVTATKRAQAEIDVPFAIEAVSGKRLQDYNINDLRDLSSVVPNLIVTDAITSGTVAIRGIGSGQDRGFEQAVALYVDGVYMPRSRQYIGAFVDVERVEVLRGPQAALFGLNATAGAISIITAQTNPGDEFTASVFGEYDFSHGGTKAGGVVGGSVSDTFAVRVAGEFTRGGAYMYNEALGRDVGDLDSSFVRGSFVFEPSDKTSIVGKLAYQDYDRDGLISEIYGGNASNIEPNDGILNFRNNQENFIAAVDPFSLFDDPDHPGTKIESWNFSLHGDTEIGQHALTAILGYSEFDYNFILDLDSTTAPLFDSQILEKYDQTSIELRVTSPSDGKFDYFYGVYYQDSTSEQGLPNVYGPGLLGAGTGFYAKAFYDLDTEVLSAYGSVGFNVSDRLRLIASGRWVTEDKGVFRDSACNLVVLPDGPVLPPGGLSFLCPDPLLDKYSTSRSTSNFLPEGVIQYDVNDDLMVYGRIAKSVKSGGYAASLSAKFTGFEYDEESVVGYEAGLKTVFGGVAKLNMSVFRSEFKDLQVNTFLVDGALIIPLIDNAAKAVTQGIEVEGRIALTEWLTVGGAAAYLDAEFDSFPAAPCHTVATPGPSGSCDLSGSRMPFAPKWSGSVFADINRSLSNEWGWFAGMGVSFSSEYFTNGTVDPNAIQDSFSRISARAGFEYPDRYRFELIGSNLTNEAVSGTTQPLAGVFITYPEPPRMVTLRATVLF